MKSIYICAVAMIIIGFEASGQVPQQLWLNEWDGLLTAKKDKGNVIITDAEGHVYVTGIVYENESKGDLATACYNADGTLIYTHHYGGDNTIRSEGQDLALASDGSVYVTGIVSENEGDICLLKFNTTGNVWQQSYEPWFNASYYDEGKELVVGQDGNVYLVGRIESISGNMADTYTAKYTSDGTFVWGIDYSGASEPDYAAGLAMSPSGKIYTATSAFNFFGSTTQDMQTICYNTEGAQQWIANYTGTSNNSNDRIKDVCVDEEDNTVVCGSLHNVNMDFAVRFQNNFSTPLWSHEKNGSANANDTAVVVCHHPLGVVATGKIVEDIDGNDITSIYTVLLDENGNELWSHIYAGDENMGADVSAMTIDVNGNIYICGWVMTSANGKNAIVLRYNSSGNLDYTIMYNGTNNFDDSFNDIVLDSNNDVLVTGQSHTASNNAVFITAKYGNGATNVATIDANRDQIKSYPNPAESEITVESKHFASGGYIELVAADGSVVLRKYVSTSPIRLDISHITSGNYILVFKSKNYESILGTQKIVKK